MPAAGHSREPEVISRGVLQQDLMSDPLMHTAR
jgi:hypothetical protein